MRGLPEPSAALIGRALAIALAFAAHPFPPSAVRAEALAQAPPQIPVLEDADSAMPLSSMYASPGRSAVGMAALEPEQAGFTPEGDFRTGESLSPDGVWREVPPPTRALHTMVYDSRRHRLLILGGTASSGRDLWQVTLDGSPNWTLLTQEGEQPPPLLGHAAVYDSQNDQMIIFGGKTPEGLSGAAYALDLSNGQHWTRLDPHGPAPGPRAFHSAVFDPESGEMFVYGGQTDDANGDISDETWVLKLGRNPHWKRLRNRGEEPGPQSFHAAVLDTKRGRMLLFARSNTPSRADEVWAMSLHTPQTWTRLAVAGEKPRPRKASALIYDPVRDRVVVFTGYGPEADDTYILDLSTQVWRSLGRGTTAPAPREQYPAVYDPVGDRMIIHGGVGVVSVLRDAWTFDLGTERWFPLTPADAGPAQMEGQAVAYDASGQRMVVFGGWARVYLGEAWALSLPDVQHWTKLGASGPQPDGRVLPSIAFDPTQDKMVMFGGLNQVSRFNDVWSLDLGIDGQWRKFPDIPGSPDGAYGHSAVFDPLRNRMVVYGSAIWLLHLGAAPVWELLPPSTNGPGPRYTHAVFYDSRRDRMILYGGVDAHFIRGDVWALDMATLQWSLLAGETNAPPKRNAHTAVWDEKRDRMVIWGGLNSGRDTDAWAFSFADNTWSKLDPAGPRPPGRGHGLGIYDVDRDRMVIFGGEMYGGLWALEWGSATPGTADRRAAQVVSAPQSPAHFTIYPNPVFGSQAITVDGSEPAVVEVLDIAGRCVARRGLSTGGRVVVETATLASGTYVVRLTGRSWTESRRVCVLR